MDCIRNFELKQMSYCFKYCIICTERRIDMQLKGEVCKRCFADKATVKLFSSENNMNPKLVPNEPIGICQL